MNNKRILFTGLFILFLMSMLTASCSSLSSSGLQIASEISSEERLLILHYLLTEICIDKTDGYADLDIGYDEATQISVFECRNSQTDELIFTLEDHKFTLIGELDTFNEKNILQ